MGETQAEMAVQIAKSPILTKNKTEPKPRVRNSNSPISKDQVQLVMLAVDNLRDSTFLHLGFNLGWRVSEPLSFTQDSINWEERKIRIWDEKKNQFRNVIPPQESMAKLRQYINETKPGPERVFSFSWKTAERLIQKWTMRAVGFKKSWHAVRHTYVSLAREQGVPIEVVAANTGDTIETLLKIYSNPSDTHRRKVADEQAIYKEG